MYGSERAMWDLGPASQAKQEMMERQTREALNPFQADWQNQNVFEFNPYREGTAQHQQWQQRQAQALQQGQREQLRNELSQKYDRYYAGDVEAARIAALRGGQPQAGPGAMPNQLPAQGAGGGQMSAQVEPRAGLREVQTQLKYDAAGRPIRNNYTSITDAQGNLASNLSLAGRIGPNVQANTAAIDALRSRATAQGPSAWAQMAEQNQRLQESQALGNQNRMNMANQNRAFNSLAQRGGLSAGQRERLAAQGMNQGLRGQQQIMGQGMQQRLGINMQDEQMKNQLLGQSASADMNLANFNQGQRAFNANAQQFDIGNSLRDIGGLNAYNAGAFSEAMKEWGATKTADAQARAASGGGKK